MSFAKKGVKTRYTDEKEWKKGVLRKKGLKNKTFDFGEFERYNPRRDEE